METSSLLIYGLGVLAAGCVLLVLLPYLSGDIKAEKRIEIMQAPKPRRLGERVVDVQSRRKQIVDNLKEVEQRKTSRKVSLETKLMQAGLEWSKRTYILVCAGLGLLLGFLVFYAEDSPLMGGAAALVGALGLPRWIMGFLRRRRIKKFVNEFPSAVDIIIRGVKAGLPLGDCLRVIASESSEPLRTEFRRIVEAQTVGLSVTEAVERLPDRVPVPESNFFAIVIGIQQKAGGNLSEALANLSKVIRERKKMAAKVKAVSSEANTSAAIIGALPFIVGFFVYLTTPKYMEMLWTTSTGRIVCLGCLAWMGVGIGIMKKMISFDM